jgi:hypothetical protein
MGALLGLLCASWLMTMNSAAARQAPPQTPAPPASWLDRPLSPWNVSGSPMPKATRGEESRANVMKRCDLKPLGSTAGERALADAGWIPYYNFDQQLRLDDLEIVGGMTAADGMCRPVGYNLFVFVGGHFAGTLSPAPMTSRLDSSSGAVRIAGKDVITVDFVRYTSTDPLCCPSSHVAVRYKIDRSVPSAVVVPTEIRARS